jgi:hypothetical protein
VDVQTDRYEEYPKLKELVQRKDELVSVRATPPYYLKVNSSDHRQHQLATAPAITHLLCLEGAPTIRLVVVAIKLGSKLHCTPL